MHGELLREKGDINASIDEFEHALSVAADDGQRVQARVGIATGLYFKDRYDDALTLLDSVKIASTKDGPMPLLAEVENRRGYLLERLGQMEACQRACERALEIARAAGAAALEIQALSSLGCA